MLFSHPWMLIGMGLCAVPVLIHLLSRRTYRRERWAAMRFLRAALDRRARQLRLESLLLLLLRTILVLLIALAAAEPLIFVSGPTSAVHAPIQRILVFDLSASLGRRVAGERLVDRARSELEGVLSAATPGDSFQLVRISTLSPRTLIRRETYDPGDVRNEIARWELTAERGDVAGSLQAVLDLLRAPAARDAREVLVFSDLQRSNWLPEQAAARVHIQQLLAQIAERAQLRFVPAGGVVTGNLAVTELQASRSLVPPQQEIELMAKIHNYGRAAVATRLEWLVDGRMVESTPVEIEGERDTTLRYLATAASAGTLGIEVRIATDDGLTVDNRRYQTVLVRPELRVLLVDGRPGLRPIDGAAGYVALALSPPSPSAGRTARQVAVRPDVVPDTELPDQELRTYDVVWLCDVARVASDQRRRLTDYVRGGGGLIVSPGDQFDVAAWNEWQTDSQEVFLPTRVLGPADVAANGEAVAFEIEAAPHPVMQPFVGNPSAGLSTTRIRRYLRVEQTENPATRRVLQFSDGQPAIVEHTVGRGRVALVLTSVDDRWGNWAVWPSFVPLVHSLAVHAAVGDVRQSQLLVGDVVERLWPPSWQRAESAIISPAGQRTLLTPRCNAEECRLQFEETANPGIYALETGPPISRREGLAVNCDPVESQPGMLDEASLARELLRSDRFSFGAGGVNPATAPSSPTARGSLAGMLLATALGLVVVESLLAWRGRWGLALLVALGVVTAVWQSARVHPWAAAALLMLVVAAGAVLRQRLAAPDKHRPLRRSA